MTLWAHVLMRSLLGSHGRMDTGQGLQMFLPTNSDLTLDIRKDSTEHNLTRENIN